MQIVSGSEVSTPAGGAPMNPQAFRDAALAPGKIAEAIGSGVGGVFEDLSNRILDARNSKSVYDADMAMRGAKDQFLNDIATDPKLASDPKTWTPEIQARVTDTQDKILSNPGLSPVAKRHLVQATGLWGMSTISEVRTQALRREQNDIKESGFASATKALLDSTPNDGGQGVATATAVYEDLNRHGIIGPRELAQLKAEAPQRAAEGQINSIISNDPAHAVDAAKPILAKLPAERQKQYQGALQDAQHRARANNFDDMLVNMLDPYTGKIDPSANAQEKVQAAIRRGDIDPVRGKNFLAGQARENELEDKTTADAVIADAHDATGWTAASDEKGGYESYAAELRAKAALIKSPVRQQTVLNKINQQLESMKKKGELEEKPVAKQIFAQMAEDRASNGYTIPVASVHTPEVTHWWKPNEPAKDELVPAAMSLAELRDPVKVPDDQIEKQFGKGMTREKLIRAEQQHYATIQGKMRDWFNDPNNAKATYEQANEYRLTLEKPYVMGATAAALQPKKTLEAAAGKRVKQNGVTYEFDGKKWKPVE